MQFSLINILIFLVIINYFSAMMNNFNYTISAFVTFFIGFPLYVKYVLFILSLKYLWFIIYFIRVCCLLIVINYLLSSVMLVIGCAQLIIVHSGGFLIIVINGFFVLLPSICGCCYANYGFRARFRISSAGLMIEVIVFLVMKYFVLVIFPLLFLCSCLWLEHSLTQIQK